MTLQKILKESQRMLLRSLEAYYGGRRHPISGELRTLISSCRILLVLSQGCQYLWRTVAGTVDGEADANLTGIGEALIHHAAVVQIWQIPGPADEEVNPNTP
jgi:hypothetical protein